MRPIDLLQGLPGAALMREGLADIQGGRSSIAACLVEIAGPRLRRLGLLPPVRVPVYPEPERRLYHLLRLQGGDAYSRYSALLRELVSFEQALDHRLRSQDQSE